MTRKKLFLIIESVLCILTAVFLAAAAIRIYVQGAAVRASGDLFYSIYTREKAEAALFSLLPLITALAAFTVAGWILGIRDEAADKPAAPGRFDMKQSGQKAVPQKTGRSAHILRVVVLLLAIALIILGIFKGGPGDVFIKGASVCSECVGLG